MKTRYVLGRLSFLPLALVMALNMTMGLRAQEIVLPPPDGEVLQTVVTIAVPDPVAVEPGQTDPNTDPPERIDPAVFVVHRMGPLDFDLPVNYAVSGTAVAGEDYVALPGQVIIPAGQAAVRIVVEPLADEEMEREETVIIQIQPPLCIAIYPPPPECYLVGRPGMGTAVIRETDGGPINVPPVVTIESPVSGAVFKAGVVIPVEVVTKDRDGYAPRVALFADGRLVDEQTIYFLVPPPAGEPIHFQLEWANAPAGGHVLTAQATDDRGATGWSDPIRILVESGADLPEVNVVATDPEAAEPDPVPEGMMRPILLNPGIFTLTRKGGDSSLPLTVYCMLAGTAVNGIDYERLPWMVTFEAGATEAKVVVVPIDDDMPEGKETVDLVLIPPPVRLDPSLTTDPAAGVISPAPYRVGPQYRDTVVIIDNDEGPGLPPRVAIVRPVTGSVFVAPADIQLVAAAADQGGQVMAVEFFANDRSLGIVRESAMAPDGMQVYRMVWENAPQGGYRLTARATDNDRMSRLSDPVYIKVVEEPQPPQRPPLVRIMACDPIGSERADFGGTPTITFRVMRDGALESDLTVFFRIGGVAINGEDYEPIRPFVTIPAGYAGAEVVIRPVPDREDERPESVVLALQLPPNIDPATAVVPPYLIGRPARAAGMILDRESTRPPCWRLPDGMVHLRVAPDINRCFVVEASSDMRRWEWVGEAVWGEDGLNFIDPDGPLHPCRFYRVRPVPCPEF